MSFFIDTSQLDELMRTFEDFEAHLKGPVARTGAYAMADTAYRLARQLAPISEHAHTFYGRDSVATGVAYRFQPGSLLRALYLKHSPERSSETLQVYRVSWNHNEAPYGHMVEFGTLRAAAHSFLGKAFYATKGQLGTVCVEAMRKRLLEFRVTR